MAASITLGSVVVGTTGKTVTATVSGGTGTGYAITDDTDLTVAVTGGPENFALVGTAVGIVGTTLTLTLATPVGQGETARLDIAATATITDSGGNTAQGQSNVAVTNNSTVTVRTLTPVTDAASFEYNILMASSPARNGDVRVFSTADAPVEFVTDATDVGVLCLGPSTAAVRVDGGSSYTPPPGRGFWACKPLTAAPLAAGKHLFLLDYGDYFHGIRISGGTRTMYTVPTTKRTPAPTASGYVQVPAATQVGLSGIHADQGDGSCNCGSLGGFTAEFAYTGSGFEINTVADQYNTWAVSNDGGQPGALRASADAATAGGYTHYAPLAEGLAAGTHQAHAMMVGPDTNTFHRLVKIINGTKTTASSAVSDTSLVVASVAQIAVNDWVKIDKFGKREWRQVTAITGSGPYTLTVAALANTHAAGAAVTSYSAAAGTISAYQRKTFTKLIAAMGDSNTQGANPLGLSGTPDALGNYYSQYDPRTWAGYLMGQPLGIDVVNLGVQGQATDNMVGRAGEFATYARGGYDAVTIWAGTNDIHANVTTPAQYKANVQTLITAAAAQLKVGGKILLMPPGTQVGETSAKGLDIAVCLAKLLELQAENPTVAVVTDDLLEDLVSGDLDGVHYKASGQAKVSNRLAKWVAGHASLYRCTGAGTVVPVAFTVV